MTSAKVIPLPSSRICPICGKPAVAPNLPFCSPRCADVDLNRWLSGSYVIPGDESDDPATDSGADELDR